MDWLRQRVRDLLTPELAGHGEIGGGHGRVVNHDSAHRGGNDPDYLLRRLKRDAPEAAAIAPAT